MGVIGVIGGIGRVTAVGTLGRASVPVKKPDTVTFDTTDAQIVRPYSRYTSRGLHVTGPGRVVARHYLVPLPAVDVSS